MRQKTISVVLAAVIAVGVAACGGDDDGPATPSDNNPASTTLPEEMVPTTSPEDQ